MCKMTIVKIYVRLCVCKLSSSFPVEFSTKKGLVIRKVKFVKEKNLQINKGVW